MHTEDSPPALGKMLLSITSLLLFTTIKVLLASESPEVTISAWQFCEGCKITVDAYANLATKEILRLEKLPNKDVKTLDALKVMDHMCDDMYFQDYKDFAKYSCIKILDDTRTKFLEEFTGSATLASLSSKKDIISKKEKICVNHTKACKAEAFRDSTIVGSKRNKCAACTLIANDIDATKRAKHNSLSLRSILASDEKSYCDMLGYKHMPYAWIEEVCEEMLEEKLDAIVEVVAFHDQVTASGFAPDQTLPQMMCEEFYHCDKDLNVSKQKKDNSKNKNTNKNKNKAKSGKAGEGKKATIEL